jgi:uncharacterized protein (DUF885 family)
LLNRMAFKIAALLGITLLLGSTHAVTAPGEFDPTREQMPGLIERYAADRESLRRTYEAPVSPVRDARFKEFYKEWLNTLHKVNFSALNQDGKIDYLLLQNHLTGALRQLELRKKQMEEMSPLMPFAKIILELDDSRRRMESPKPIEDAKALTSMVKEISLTREAAEAGLAENDKRASVNNTGAQALHVKKTVARRASVAIKQLREMLKKWFSNYNGYDPQFAWWVDEPYKEADQALDEYGKFVTEKLVGLKADDKTTIIGDPIGRDALLLELEDAMIPYTPEELVALGKNEMAWCTKEMLRASNEMGFGDDWHKALDHVKDLHVDPGQQPELIRGLALEAIDFVEKHDLITVPPLAKEDWGMDMMSPERQLVNPFFTGGERITVSFPTDTMTFEQRMMSMRGNNIPFARATVFHELIPGHHLQGFMTARFRSYRRVFETPFWIEGNAFYWEMLLWDMGFPKTPEERVGMLFWRMHRCARVIFSLSFHLGLMTPEQCVEFLIKNVGHERDNAAAEVRRSFDGSYGPLYQAAYMLGALQFRALHRELVSAGHMANREFHDAILKENDIPVEMLRAKLLNEPLTADFKSTWKFYGPIPHAP